MSMQPVSADSENKIPAILYEDELILVVDKPAGLIVHHDGRTAEPSLMEWLKLRYPALEHVGGLHTLDSEKYTPRFGVLHRLDRETSGVILIAKSDEVFFPLQRQFLKHSIRKVYRAFCWGTLERAEGDIELEIGRNRADFRQWTTGEGARGTLRSASTHYQVLHQGDGVAYVELTPKTGRTHQLRVHMKALGHPILSDKRYASPAGLGFRRVALHAFALHFIHPTIGKMAVEASLPEDFRNALSLLG